MKIKKTKEELAKLQSLDMVEYFKKVTAKEKMELEKNTAKHLSEKWEYREMKGKTNENKKSNDTQRKWRGKNFK